MTAPIVTLRSLSFPPSASTSRVAAPRSVPSTSEPDVSNTQTFWSRIWDRCSSTCTPLGPTTTVAAAAETRASSRDRSALSLELARINATATTSTAAVSVETSSAVAAIRARNDGGFTATGSRPRGPW